MREALEYDELDSLERLAAAATPGPWTPDVEHLGDGDTRVMAIRAPSGGAIVLTDCGNYPPKLADAFFIAAAREAVPVLVRDVRDARDAAEQAIAARAVKLDATNVLIVYAGEEGPIKVADKLQELVARAEGAEERGRLVLAAKNEWADRARAAESAVLACAQAIGVSYEAEGRDSAPGPLTEVVKHITEARHAAEDVAEYKGRAERAEAAAGQMGAVTNAARMYVESPGPMCVTFERMAALVDAVEKLPATDAGNEEQTNA